MKSSLKITADQKTLFAVADDDDDDDDVIE